MKRRYSEPYFGDDDVLGFGPCNDAFWPVFWIFAFMIAMGFFFHMRAEESRIATCLSQYSLTAEAVARLDARLLRLHIEVSGIGDKQQQDECFYTLRGGAK